MFGRVHYRNFSALKVRLGDWDIYRDVEPRPHFERPVASITIHPEYSPSNMHNDIAVITLSGASVPVTDHVSPVCLPMKPPPGAVSPRHQWTGCQVSGWGSESFDQPRYPGVLKKVPVPLWDRQRCVESLRTTRLGAAFKLHSGFLCAGGEENEDACKVSENISFRKYHHIRILWVLLYIRAVRTWILQANTAAFKCIRHTISQKSDEFHYRWNWLYCQLCKCIINQFKNTIKSIDRFSISVDLQCSYYEINIGTYAYNMITLKKQVRFCQINRLNTINVCKPL